MPTDFKTYMESQLPPWMRETYGRVLARAIGDLKDDLIDRAKDAVKSGFPDYAANDALDQIGIERQIERGPNELRAPYAARVKHAWETWPYAGTPTGVLSAFFHAGYTPVELVTQKGNHYRRNATTGIADNTYTNATEYTFSPLNFWNTFLVYFYALPADWVANGIPSSSSKEAQAIKALIEKWKPVHSICSGILINDGGAYWGQQGVTWGQGGLVWGPGARFWSFDYPAVYGTGAYYGDGSTYL